MYIGSHFIEEQSKANMASSGWLVSGFFTEILSNITICFRSCRGQMCPCICVDGTLLYVNDLKMIIASSSYLSYRHSQFTSCAYNLYFNKAQANVALAG